MDTTADLLSYREAADYLNLPSGTLRALVHHDRIPHVRFGPRTVRFRRASLDAWLDELELDSGADAAQERAAAPWAFVDPHAER